jgi:hypothetical protein
MIGLAPKHRKYGGGQQYSTLWLAVQPRQTADKWVLSRLSLNLFPQESAARGFISLISLISHKVHFFSETLA